MSCPYEVETAGTRNARMLAAIAYDIRRQHLYLGFRKTDGTYRCLGFPATEYRAFLDAEFHGRLFVAHIRDHYDYQRLTKVQVA
jgi:hypothetical protein